MDVLETAIHEIGHSLGLGHSNNQASVMFPTTAFPTVELCPEDIRMIQALYGSKRTGQAATRVAGTDYQILRHLGSGHFGDVFLAKSASGKSFAIKKVVNTEKNTAQQEIRILRMVDHECIIKYYDHYMEKGILIPLLNRNLAKSDLTDYSQGVVWPSVIQAQPRP